MIPLAAKVLAATMMLAALSGCSDETEIQGINVKFVNEADRQVMVEVWTTTRPEGGKEPGDDFVIGPGTHPWTSVFADCGSNEGSIYLQAYLKEPTRNYPGEHETLASKRWNGLQCHELYTVIIDQDLGMTMYHCDPCKGTEQPV